MENVTRRKIDALLRPESVEDYQVVMSIGELMETEEGAKIAEQILGVRDILGASSSLAEAIGDAIGERLVYLGKN